MVGPSSCTLGECVTLDGADDGCGAIEARLGLSGVRVSEAGKWTTPCSVDSDCLLLGAPDTCPQVSGQPPGYPGAQASAAAVADLTSVQQALAQCRQMHPLSCGPGDAGAPTHWAATCDPSNKTCSSTGMP
jgi:hypothetical protein